MRHYPTLGQFQPQRQREPTDNGIRKWSPVTFCLKYIFSLVFGSRSRGRLGVNSTPRMTKGVESQTLPPGSTEDDMPAHYLHYEVGGVLIIPISQMRTPALRGYVTTRLSHRVSPPTPLHTPGLTDQMCPFIGVLSKPHCHPGSPVRLPRLCWLSSGKKRHLGRLPSSAVGRARRTA